MWPVFKLQKMAVRLIMNVSRKQSSSQYFKKLQLLKVPDIYDVSVAIFVYHFIHSNLPITFENYFTLNGEIHNISTRQSNDFRTPTYRSQLGSKFVKKTGVVIWKTISDSYGFHHLIHQFKILTLADKLAGY